MTVHDLTVVRFPELCAPTHPGLSGPHRPGPRPGGVDPHPVGLRGGRGGRPPGGRSGPGPGRALRGPPVARPGADRWPSRCPRDRPLRAGRGHGRAPQGPSRAWSGPSVRWPRNDPTWPWCWPGPRAGAKPPWPPPWPPPRWPAGWCARAGSTTTGWPGSWAGRPSWPTRRAMRASGSRRSRPWRPGCRWWPPPPGPCPRSWVTPPGWSPRATPTPWPTPWPGCWTRPSRPGLVEAGRRRAAGFSWSSCAAGLAGLYREAVG